MDLSEGQFVIVDDLDLGIGKLEGLTSTEAEVSYFASPARGEARRACVLRERVHPHILDAQTRVYWEDDARGWVVGRVAEDGRIEGELYGADEDLYFIELPNDESARIPISALRVRWNRPVDDPVAYLAARTIETPFWHQGRRNFLRHLVDQRAHCSSLTGLWSAAVNLVSYQFRTVQTVLTDPVQRYLLADEVGLGKTIEAGAILRQYILDEPNEHHALVVVPLHLAEQWKEELDTRFYLGDLIGDSIRIVASDDPAPIVDASPRTGMLIVDEAHQVSAFAFAPDKRQRDYYGVLARLAKRTPRVLLLSATPALGNEDGFLAMLHLLEPDAYPLDDREAFRRRVVNRQQIAETMSDLRPDGLFLEDALDSLGPLSKGDAQATRLIERVRERVEDVEDDPVRQLAIRNLREHVSEVYRLHRRLIRHRRATTTEVPTRRDGVAVLTVADPVRQRYADLLEQWRDQANLVDNSPSASRLYILLLAAALSHPMVLRELVVARRHRRAPDPKLVPTGADLTPLAYPSVFAGEDELLDSLLKVEGAHGFPRRMQLLNAIAEGRKRRLKTVIFVDTEGVADSLAATLAEELDDGVLRHAQGVTLDPFLDDKDESITVLVCDWRAEEGLNLQEARSQALHLDLPLAPGRLEQRLGRLDRYGARRSFRSLVFADTDSIAEAWRRCLQDVIKVFERSVASLQYVLAEQMQWLRDVVFGDGVEAFEELSVRLTHSERGLDAELKRIRTEEELDGMEGATTLEQDEFQKLDDFDAEDELLRKGLESWAVGRLHFGTSTEAETRTRRYHYMSSKGRRTLVSPQDFVGSCGRAFHSEPRSRSRSTSPMTFDRLHALKHRAQLGRLGHPFIDGLADLARRDDRGVAYAMWRCRPSLELPHDPWVVFGFDFLIEAPPQTVAEALPPNLQGTSMAALRRRLDTIFPPHYLTVWLDQELEVVESPTLLRNLEQEYDGRPNVDRNLNVRRWEQVAPLLELGAWDELCVAASGKALEIAGLRIGLDARTREAQARIDDRLSRVRVQLEARLSRAAGRPSIADELALEIEESFARGAHQTVLKPKVAPDSAFAVVLSNSDPFTGDDRR